MRLLTGPAGSGKTHRILEEFRAALRAGDDSVRLLVPTATLAQHRQNQLAREGFVFRRGLIQTLSGFLEPWAAGTPQVPETVFYLIVEEAARRVNRPEFARVLPLPGFCASLARTMQEFSSAGCDSVRLAAHLPDAPLAAAFLAIYREVDTELARRGLALRARRIEIAAERIAAEGLGGVESIWLDGFHALPEPELRVLQALGRHAKVTLAIGESSLEHGARERLEAIGFVVETMARTRSTPAVALVKAPNMEREVEEIARRILDQAAAGRPFREIGIVVRAADAYVPILRSTLERFGIPARFYFDSNLDERPAVRFLTGVVDAMLAGWPHEQVLRALRLTPRLADYNGMDRFDFSVRERLPDAGLEPLKSPAAEDGALQRAIAELETLEAWRHLTLAPQEWAARFHSLRNLCRAARPREGADHQLALIYRDHTASLDAFDQALDEAAVALPSAALPLAGFWAAVKSAIRLTPLRLRDGRRNAVHVLSAPEARQWVLPVVFICGVVEKHFPQFHRQEPFFPESARMRLNAAGICVRTAAEFEREERSLFEAAITRATMLVTLSYPEFDARGDRNLPSIFLEDLPLAVEESRAVRPRPRFARQAPAAAAIHSPALLDWLRQRSARLSPSGLESYLQCAFRFFGGNMLRLRTAPDRPEKRLNNNFLRQGEIVHEVLATWYAQPQDIEALFDAIFQRKCEELRIPNGYHTERLRNAMLDDLRAFGADDQWPRNGFQSLTEKKFEFALDDSLTIAGRIDRIDTAPDGRAFVIDYKYSAAQRTRGRLEDENLLQAPLYMMAAERAFGIKPAGMFYIGLKGGVEYVGWSDNGLLESEPIPDNWLELARQRTLQAADEIRGGRIAADPADRGGCRFCDSRDICRIDVARPADIAEGA
jgi:ATP-dependent helicase/DNAse subunit B